MKISSSRRWPARRQPFPGESLQVEAVQRVYHLAAVDRSTAKDKDGIADDSNGCADLPGRGQLMSIRRPTESAALTKGGGPSPRVLRMLVSRSEMSAMLPIGSSVAAQQRGSIGTFRKQASDRLSGEREISLHVVLVVRLFVRPVRDVGVPPRHVAGTIKGLEGQMAERAVMNAPFLRRQQSTLLGTERSTSVCQEHLSISPEDQTVIWQL